MSKPTRFPDWATDGSNVVETPAGKVATGWLTGDRPPAGWINWWNNLVGLWTRYFDTEVTTLTTRMGSAEGSITNLTPRMSTAESNITGLTSRMGVAETDINTLESQYAAISNAALKHVNNLFTQSQVINVQDATPDWALIETTQGPGSRSGFASNRWKLILKVPTQGSGWASLYVGQSPDVMALVNNARWLPGTPGQWRQIDKAYPSTALIGKFWASGGGALDRASWYVSFKPINSNDWQDWPTENGADFFATRDVSTPGEFAYHGTAHNNVSKEHNIGSFSGTGKLSESDSGGNHYAQWTELLDGQHVLFPLRVPDGGTLGQVYVKVRSTGFADTPTTVRLMRRHNINHGAAFAPDWTVVSEATPTIWLSTDCINIGTATGGGPLSFGNLSVAKNETYSVYVRNTAANGAGTVLRIYGLEYQFKDPGPRNR